MRPVIATRPSPSVHRLEIEARPRLPDPLAQATIHRLAVWLDVHPRALRTRKVYHLDLGLDSRDAERVLAALTDPIAEVGALGMLDDPLDPLDQSEAPWVVEIGLLPGVTDPVGRSVERAAEDCLGRPLIGHAYSSILYLVWGIERDALERATRELLYNPLIQRARIERAPREPNLAIPRAGTTVQPGVARVALREADDDALETISRKGMLALTVVEMRAIQAHFRRLARDPTDAELECLAQTWSEHCKHKIFASPIAYVDPQGESRTIAKGLFRSYVRGATEQVVRDRAARGLDGDAPFLVSVFHDNAGVVRFSELDHLCYKVETHNSPSALDPYGGAMTGIVGVNRDSFGTGLGADLLANVWGYCFGDPHWDVATHGALPAGLMHPRRIRDGVHEGVIDGGNQSGIPWARGFELFDVATSASHWSTAAPSRSCRSACPTPKVGPDRPTKSRFDPATKS